jgi:Rrf2 family iron-sulfur cluster assembly transcriptional regulator
MILSKSCEYAIRASIYIAKQSEEGFKSSIVEISEAIKSPQHFTAKILQVLVKSKIISSHKGPTGGFFIEADQDVYIIDIVKAIDGDGLFTNCVLGLKLCSDKEPCPLHNEILTVRTKITHIFSKKSLKGLAADFDINNLFLS